MFGTLYLHIHLTCVSVPPYALMPWRCRMSPLRGRRVPYWLLPSNLIWFSYVVGFAPISDLVIFLGQKLPQSGFRYSGRQTEDWAAAACYRLGFSQGHQMAWRKNTRSVVPKQARNSSFTKNTAQIEEAKNKEIHENHREYHCFLLNAGELRCKIMLSAMKNVAKPRNFEHLVHVQMPKKVILLARFPTPGMILDGRRWL